MKRIELVARPDCHLCELLLEQLRPLLTESVELAVLDVDEDEDLLRRYWLRIPVLLGNGEELSGYPLDLSRLEAYLAA